MVRGNPTTVRTIAGENAVAVVQVENPKIGLGSYPVRVLPEQLSKLVMDGAPLVNIELEEIQVQEVNVSVETTGKLADNRYVLEDLLASPSRVVVKGPKSDLGGELRATAVIDLDSVEANRAIPYPVTVQVKRGSGAAVQYAIVTPSTVNVTPTFAPAPIEFPAFVSLDLGRVKAAEGFEIVGYRTSPEQVTVYGTSLNVARVGTVPTAPIIASQIRSTQTIEVPLKPPAGVNVRPRSVQVTIEVRQKAVPDVSNGPRGTAAPADGNTTNSGT
jgi:YbbR domain-containing protein